jgi:putative two-component system response regulator
MAVADVYDALISKRVYKSEYLHDDAVKIIYAEKGSHFDPDIVDAFMHLEKDFHEIALKFTDSE